MSEKYEIVVRPFHWTEQDAFTIDDTTTIHCWALDRDSKPNLIRILGFPVMAHIELPSYVEGRAVRWDRDNSAQLVENIKFRLKDHGPTKSLLIFKEKLYFYSKAFLAI